ncbi:benzoyl-CoA reductase/2-hydroxyglutaryl-CoA dehydratase subunit BcrC/BadD/HgdB [Paenibacillus forsythiae]|uniref:Benzoyl-CoA reductase/2-hydroxyglutaryl-CoA dehydratase subunit BcrC/BadD/HgdB n=1 Tax=Paenibacillus forsythiae TaxID=365616 RepID=A0ABU3H3G2_9BACL|nr:2-hydroxyacyl-CoA dehydratase family protein [Paenibacillus forsythiae]MDT3425358.1 benzoyl-CoA reductase/2-hydroxyglutaryl-CoA dehydratase subunit BcrC/BadD/HgdB [Paenibacillus forsythiae]
MTLQSVELIRKRVAERPAELAEARTNGQKVVGWQGYNLPEELIYALGLIPVRIGAGGDDRLVEIGARYISTKNCVYVRETVGLFAENKDPIVQNTDFLAFDATCLQTYRTAEILEYYFNKEVVVLGVPRNFYWPEAQVYFTKEVEHFTGRLEELSGARLDHDKLAETIELYNRIRGAIVEIYEYQAERERLISWEETYDIIHAGYVLDRKEYLRMLEGTLRELQEAQGRPAPEEEDEARIFISGSVIPPGDKKLIHIINAVGGRIVGDDLWSGLIPYLDVHIGENTVEGVALAYINRTPHGALPYLELETDKRIKRLKELVKNYKAHGVIYHTLRYCDPYSFKAKETKDVLAAEGIPLLEIHTEYSGSDYEAIRTRIEAFVEMLKIRNFETLRN